MKIILINGLEVGDLWLVRGGVWGGGGARSIVQISGRCRACKAKYMCAFYYKADNILFGSLFFLFLYFITLIFLESILSMCKELLRYRPYMPYKGGNFNPQTLGKCFYFVLCMISRHWFLT